MPDASTVDSTIDWAKLLYGVYKDQHPAQGKFVMPPTSPTTEAIQGKYLGWMDNGGPTNKALAPAIVGNMKANNPDFTLPGYIGAQSGQPNALPNGGHVGGAMTNWDDMLKGLITPGGGSSTPTVPPSPTGTLGSGTSPTGVPGDAFGHIGAPAGSSGDPFANWPTFTDNTPVSSTDKSSLLDLAKKYGPAAGEFALSLLQGNPFLSAKAAYDALKVYLRGSGDKTPQPMPGNPGDFGKGNYDPNAPAPREYINPTGASDHWSVPFMGGGVSGGAGGSDPGLRGYDWRNSIINGPSQGPHGQYR